MMELEPYWLLRQLVGIATWNVSSEEPIDTLEIWNWSCACVERWQLSWSLSDQVQLLNLLNTGLIPTADPATMQPRSSPSQAHILALPIAPVTI
jgi:hypothetical protein